jgi:glycosyltransferase involved in cell wall biosynthesis
MAPHGPAAAALPGTMRAEPSPRPLAVAIAYSRLPLPMTRADQMTVAHLIAFLAARGHAIDLYTLDNGEPISAEQRAWLNARCRSVHIFPQRMVRRLLGLVAGLLRGLPLQVGWFLNAAQSAALARGIGDCDLGYCYYIRSAEAMRGLRAVRPTFLAMQLSQALNTRRMVAHYRNWRERLLYAVEGRLVRSYEPRVWRDFTRTVLIGADDAAEIRRLCRGSGLPEIDNVVFGPHGVDVRRFAPRPDVTPAPRSLVFNGVLRTYTNVHAITWFVEHVFPLVRAGAPDATLTIVGRDPRSEVRALHGRDGVTVTGEVADPADWIARAELCIDPVQAGAGMQNKLIEFMAMGKPVVATTVANEGIGAMPGEHLVLADEPGTMADAILALFADPSARIRLGVAARRFVEEGWSWEAQYLRLEAEMVRAVDEAGGP